MPKFYGVTLYAEVKLVVKADDSDEACDSDEAKLSLAIVILPNHLAHQSAKSS